MLVLRNSVCGLDSVPLVLIQESGVGFSNLYFEQASLK